jgi:type IV pilus assembly protein PilO
MALADTLKVDKIIKLPWYQKALILGGIAACILALYFLTLDRTYKRQITGLQDQISTLDKKITDLQAIKKDLPKFERQNALLKKELDKAMTKLPSTSQVDELLKDVTIKARTNGIDVISFDKQQDVTQALYIEVPVNMKLRGNFFPLMIFFNEIARMERIINISDISFQHSTSLSLLDVTCTLTAYRFKEAAPAPETTQKQPGKAPTSGE